MSEPLLHDILLLYLYNESDLCESYIAQSAIDADPLVASDFRELSETALEIQRSSLMSAPAATLQAILTYARATAA